MQEQNQQVIKAIQDACPDLMKLSFGYRMKSGTGIYTYIYLDSGVIIWASKSLVIPDSETLIKSKHLGHPIQLSHVLRAIYKRWKPSKEYERQLLGKWVMEKTYEDQDQTVKDFLYDVLIKE